MNDTRHLLKVIVHCNQMCSFVLLRQNNARKKSDKVYFYFIQTAFEWFLGFLCFVEFSCFLWVFLPFHVLVFTTNFFILNFP